MIVKKIKALLCATIISAACIPSNFIISAADVTVVTDESDDTASFAKTITGWLPDKINTGERDSITSSIFTEGDTQVEIFSGTYVCETSFYVNEIGFSAGFDWHIENSVMCIDDMYVVVTDILSLNNLDKTVLDIPAEIVIPEDFVCDNIDMGSNPAVKQFISNEIILGWFDNGSFGADFTKCGYSQEVFNILNSDRLTVKRMIITDDMQSNINTNAYKEFKLPNTLWDFKENTEQTVLENIERIMVEDGGRYKDYDGVLFDAVHNSMILCPPKYHVDKIIEAEFVYSYDFDEYGIYNVAESSGNNYLVINAPHICDNAFNEKTVITSAINNENNKALNLLFPRSVGSISDHDYLPGHYYNTIIFLNDNCYIDIPDVDTEAICGFNNSTASNLANNLNIEYRLFTDSAPVCSQITGDVNDDGNFSIADIVLFRRWLVKDPESVIINWEMSDLNKDDKLDVFDFCLMKRMLLNEKIPYLLR